MHRCGKSCWMNGCGLNMIWGKTSTLSGSEKEQCGTMRVFDFLIQLQDSPIMPQWSVYLQELAQLVWCDARLPTSSRCIQLLLFFFFHKDDFAVKVFLTPLHVLKLFSRAIKFLRLVSQEQPCLCNFCFLEQLPFLSSTEQLSST